MRRPSPSTEPLFQIATLNVTIHRQEATKKSYQDRIDNKTAENKDLRSILNETYNMNSSLEETGGNLPGASSTRIYSPERASFQSPDFRSTVGSGRSPSRAFSPGSARSSPVHRRQRSVSPPPRTSRTRAGAGSSPSWRQSPIKDSTYRYS